MTLQNIISEVLDMSNRTIHRGDLYYYDFGNSTGSVQSGERPVLVVQADDYNRNAPTIMVAAVTSVMKKRYLPSHITLGCEFGLKKPSIVLLEQIRTVNKEDLQEYILDSRKRDDGISSPIIKILDFMGFSRFFNCKIHRHVL